MTESLLSRAAQLLRRTAIPTTEIAYETGLPGSEQYLPGFLSGQCMVEMLLYAYDHLDAFKLLLLCAEGTRFTRMVYLQAESQSWTIA